MCQPFYRRSGKVASELRFKQMSHSLLTTTYTAEFHHSQHFHIWSYSAVWMGDNEAGLFQHSWHFDREWDTHCWDAVVGVWCHVGEPKRSRYGEKQSLLCPSSWDYDLSSLTNS